MRALPSLLLILAGACIENSGALAQRSEPLPACEWCGAAEIPAHLSADAQIAPSTEPGERMAITGVVLRPDGVTPAAGVVLYVYHTNAAGIYPKRGDETGNARRHGYLRAWLRTDAHGRYRFTTIRPAHYPGRSGPAHVHVTVTEPGRPEYWLDDFVFEGDPEITPRYRAEQEYLGGSGIVRLTRRHGMWQGSRTIVLPRAERR